MSQKIHFISYGNHVFNNSKKRLYKEANDSGWFHTINMYGPEFLSDSFKNDFGDILEKKKGGGYWIWKPYIIKKKLDEIEDNDILIYLDSGCTLNTKAKKRFDEYIEMLDNSNLGIICFQTAHPEHTYTKKEILDHFNIDEKNEHYNSRQNIATVVMIKKNKNSIKIINEWYETLNNNPSLFTDHTKVKHPGYIANRHDQSILSIISKLHGNILLGQETFFIGLNGVYGGFGQKESLKYPFWATRKK